MFMMTLSNGNIFRVAGPLCGEFTGHQLVNNLEAGDLRSHHTHSDVIVMCRLYNCSRISSHTFSQ